MQDKTKVIEFNSPWIADGIGDDFKQWQTKKDINSQRFFEQKLTISTLENSHVFIESATGTGKTSFILNKLLPYAIDKNRHILYISNRTALLQQVENEVATRFNDNLIEIAKKNNAYSDNDSERNNIPYRLLKLEHLNFYMGLCNYHSLTSFLKTIREHGIEFYYIIFDEIHFFVEDALFNPWTYQIYLTILNQFPNSVFIMLSATMEEVIDDFLEGLTNTALRQIYNKIGNSVPIEPICNPNIYIYRNTYHRDAYELAFYKDDDALIELICQSNPNNKWLIFVTSKDKGDNLAKAIDEYTDYSVKFISSQNKKSAVWKKIVQQAMFDVDILITTKVLDNGININDPALKNLVLPFCDHTEFVQMLGRKRLQEGEKIKVYTALPTQKMLRSKKYQNERLYKAIAPLIEIEQYQQSEIIQRKDLIKLQEIKTRILQDYWLQNDTNINRLFLIDSSRNLIPNYFAYVKIKNLQKFYTDLLQNFYDESYFPKMVHSWLGLSEDKTTKYVTFSGCTTLKELMYSVLNEPIPEQLQELFYNEFQFLYTNMCKAIFCDDLEKCKEALSVRKGTTQRKATINRELAMLNLPYMLVKSKNCWILQKHQLEKDNKPANS